MLLSYDVSRLRKKRRLNARMGGFTGTPVHDRHSHAADAFRGLAVRHKTPTLQKPLSSDTLVYQFPSALDWMRW